MSNGNGNIFGAQLHRALRMVNWGYAIRTADVGPAVPIELPDVFIPPREDHGVELTLAGGGQGVSVRRFREGEEDWDLEVLKKVKDLLRISLLHVRDYEMGRIEHLAGRLVLEDYNDLVEGMESDENFSVACLALKMARELREEVAALSRHGEEMPDDDVKAAADAYCRLAAWFTISDRDWFVERRSSGEGEGKLSRVPRTWLAMFDEENAALRVMAESERVSQRAFAERVLADS